MLDAAFELFLEHGYDGTSMDAVARAAGVTKPVVYDCFPSKEDLFTALLQREETRDLVNATMAQLPDHYRESLEEKYVEGRSQREMAERRQMTEKALESQLSRAREAFRATFLALSRRAQMEVV